MPFISTLAAIVAVIASYFISTVALVLIVGLFQEVGSLFPGRISAAIENRGVIERLATTFIIICGATYAAGHVLFLFKRANLRACAIVFAVLSVLWILKMLPWLENGDGTTLERVISTIQGVMFGLVPLAIIFNGWRISRQAVP